MTYAPNADKFEVGKQYTVSASYKDPNKKRLKPGMVVTVIKVETLEEAGFVEGFVDVSIFRTITVKDENGDRFFVGADELILEADTADTSVAPQPYVAAPTPKNDEIIAMREAWDATILEELVSIQKEIKALKRKYWALSIPKDVAQEINALQKRARDRMRYLGRPNTKILFEIQTEQAQAAQRLTVVRHFDKIGMRQSLEW